MHLTKLTLVAATLCVANAVSGVVIDATADTYVYLRNPDTVYGGDATFETANDGGTFGLPKADDRWAIMRFDISSESKPFTTISLALEQISGDAADFVVYGVPDLGADEFFDQSTYTFNTSAYAATTNAPLNDGGLNKTNLLDLGSFSTSGAQNISFTSAEMLSFANADTNNMLTFILYQSTQNKFARVFNSSEAASGQVPQLSINAVPEPSTYALLAGALGLCITLLKRRR
ncbi:DNRLRE domain-containing protein [Cerasicoccus frondis]|uniref:DNRLRE domain-containing protein n=1 Tax=Cerasicoccus frondis TaxID=490090 RepID=UPI00285251ED|nr:DNRLRE domain-containing protein [Cerasicoccus frondis]